MLADVGGSQAGPSGPPVRRAPYVNIRLERPLPEDLTPTLPREAIAYLEEHARHAAAGSIAAMTPAPPGVVAPSATNTDDDDPDSGWDAESEPPIESAPLVPQVPVVLSSASPALAGLPPPAPLSPRPAQAYEVFRGLEALANEHGLVEVDDSLPTPAINGLPEGMIDPIPIPRPPEGSFTAPFLLQGPTPPPPPPPPVQALTPPTSTQRSSESHLAAAPVAAESPPPPFAAEPTAVSATNTASVDPNELPVVEGPSNHRQKTQRIIRVPNAPRLVPEVLTPALLSAGPYRGELHIEASASGPALPAVPGLIAQATLMPGMVRDAQPTVLAQHRLQSARAAAEEIGARSVGRKALLAAVGLGSMAGVFLVGVMALGVGRAPLTPPLHTGSIAASRLMLTALRDIERAPLAGVEVAATPSFHSSVAAPEPPREPAALTTNNRPKHAPSGPAAAPPAAAVRRAPQKGSADGF